VTHPWPSVLAILVAIILWELALVLV